MRALSKSQKPSQNKTQAHLTLSHHNHHTQHDPSLTQQPALEPGGAHHVILESPRATRTLLSTPAPSPPRAPASTTCPLF